MVGNGKCRSILARILVADLRRVHRATGSTATAVKWWRIQETKDIY